MRLYEKLIKYSEKNTVPMHMPGHKRNPEFAMHNPYSFDITEIEGMDDLFKPEGVIKDLMLETAEFYETKKTYLLVNGSTSGNLTAIASCCEKCSDIITDDACHRSVDHAVDLLGLKRHIVARDRDEFGVPGKVDPTEIERQLSKLSDDKNKPSAVFITSPTYEGVVSDIASIAEITHRYDIPLIVDAAHGAHLTLASKTDNTSLVWPKPAGKQGADLVIESLHKTLPSLTQTALLHRYTDRVPDDRVAYYHDVFTTSSPSYVLMSSIDICMQWQQTKGVSAFSEYDQALSDIYAKFPESSDKQQKGYVDPSKIILAAGTYGKDGPDIAAKLRQNGIEPELIRDRYAVLLTSPADTRDHFTRLMEVLEQQF